MTDAEGTRLLAEKLMGWKPIEYPESPRIWWDSDELSLECNWDPRSNIEHAFMLVNKMRERGLDLTLHSMPDGYHAKIAKLHVSKLGRFASDPCAARAIFMACIEVLKGEKQ